MLKKFKSSLTLRIFLITSAFMIAACAITYGAIAYLTPISYTSLLEDELITESEALVKNLAETTAEECTSVLEDFARRTGADMLLADEKGAVVYDTLSGNIIYSERPETAIASQDDTALNSSEWPESVSDTENNTAEPAEDSDSNITEPAAISDNTTLESMTYMFWGGGATGAETASDTSEAVHEVTVIQDMGSESTYYFVFSDGIGGSLIIQGGRRAVNQAAEAMQRLLPFLILVILAISLLGAFFYAQMITQPIVAISRIAKRMAALDFHVRWDKKRSDEIGVLGDSLNLLSNNLSGALSELQSANQVLQNDIERERELDRQRLTFFSAASHELKTPVTILKGQLSGMLAQVGIYRDREKYLARSLEVTSRMEELIKEILTISRIESGSFALSAVPVDISALIKNQLSMGEELIAQKNIALETYIDPCVTVRGNESLLVNVFNNVLMNAILYSPQGATVRVEVHDHALSVMNSGASIPDEALSQLFTPFYRVEQSRNRKSGGSGLGLYLVQSILKLHGATCQVENTAQGVRFSAQFP